MIKKNKKIFLLGVKNADHREIRIRRELEKRDFSVVPLNAFHLFASSDTVNYKKELVSLNDGDMLWSTSNSVMVQKITSCLERDKVFVWPNKESQIFTDKFLGNCFFKKIGIETPKTVLVNNHNLAQSIKAVGGLPCVIKRTNGSKGTEVDIVKSKPDVEKFIHKIYAKKFKSFSHWKGDFTFILQEFIAKSSGTDFRVLCLRDKIVGGIKRSSRNNDFRANVSLGGKAEKFDVPNELARICQKIMNEGKLFYAGLDFIKNENKWLAIEVNTCAQFMGFEKATKKNVAEMIVNALVEESKNIL